MRTVGGAPAQGSACLPKRRRTDLRPRPRPARAAQGGNDAAAVVDTPADEGAGGLVSARRTKAVLRSAPQADAVTVDLSRPPPPGGVAGALGIVGLAPSPAAAGGAWRGGRFRLSPAEVAALRRAHGLTEPQLLAALVAPAAALARPPVSSFHVGAVGVAASGALYVGVNLEFAGLPLYNSVHAEQFLLAAAVRAGEAGLRRVAVSAAPCGHCRQFYCELAGAGRVRFQFGGGGGAGGAGAGGGGENGGGAGARPRSYSLGRLLPLRFRPADLLPPGAPRLMDPRVHNAVRLTPRAEAAVAAAAARGDAALAAAAAAALAHARRSYAPYSRCPAGAAVVTEAGAVHAGGYIESAAFNPSLPPLQAAVVGAVADGMPCITRARAAVLVELAGGRVRHAPTAAVVLAAVAPGAELLVLEAEWEEGEDEGGGDGGGGGP